PFVTHMKNLGYNLNVTRVPNSNHNDLKLYFKDFVYNSLNNIYNLELDYNHDYKNNFTQNILKSHSVTKNEQGEIFIHLDISGKNYNIVYYILNNNNEVLFRSNPQKDNTLSFIFTQINGNRLKLFVR